MIKTFRHKGLRRLFETGQSSQVRPDLRQRCLRRLDALDQAASLAQLNIPGYRLHRLSGHKPPRYAIDVNGPWRLTFEWHDGDVCRVDLEQYH